MVFMPFNILVLWFNALLSLGLVGGGAYLLWEWYRRAYVWQDQVVPLADAANQVVVRHDHSYDVWFLVAGLALLAVAFSGGALYRILLRRRGEVEPEEARSGDVQSVTRPDGSTLRVESYGPPDGPPIVMTHGWGANSTEWHYAKHQLADRYRLIVWDLPGLGLSRGPANSDYSLEKLARDLDAVVGLAGGRPAVLVGHSIGGMIILTFCRLFPVAPGGRVSGLVLAHTTYTNPVKTAKRAGLYTALQKPLLEPLLYLTIALWPLVWVLNWMSYLNGSAHSSTDRESFSGNETRGQLDFATRFMPHASPAVLARGMLGMFSYDASETLGAIRVPTLVVAADADTNTTPEASRHMSRAIPAAELVTLSPARHMGLLEHNARFSEAVDAFASRCSAKAEATG